MTESALRLKFKIQPFQTEAVQSVVDCFVGQSFSDGFSYRIDPGRERRSRQYKIRDRCTKGCSRAKPHLSHAAMGV